MPRFPFIVLYALFVVSIASCGRSHSDEESGQDFRDVDAGTVPTDQPQTAKPDVSPACPLGELSDGIAELEIYSDSLGGELPVTFSAHCSRPDALLELLATDGLSTFRLAASEPGQGDMDAAGSFEFEDLATFAGHCNVCLGEGEGSLSCPSLIWKSGEDLVKASVTGSFRCDPAE